LFVFYKKKKRNSPVIVIKITTIYETILLKHFTNSVIIQSAKQLVFYDGTDFIVAGYRVKRLQHILDFKQTKNTSAFVKIKSVCALSFFFFFSWML